MDFALLFFLLALASLTLLAFGMIKPKKVFLGSDGTKRNVVKFYGLGFLVFFIAFVVAVPNSKQKLASVPAEAITSAPSLQPQASQQEIKAERSRAERLEKIKSMGRGITDVSEADEKRLFVTQKEKSIWSAESWANSISLWTPEFIEKLAKKYPNQYSEVTIRFVVPTKDKYGNEDQGEAMTLTYDMSEISKVNWDGVNSFDIMNFSKAYFRPLGRLGFTAWCISGNAEHARNLCLQAAQ